MLKAKGYDVAKFKAGIRFIISNPHPYLEKVYGLWLCCHWTTLEKWLDEEATRESMVVCQRWSSLHQLFHASYLTRLRGFACLQGRQASLSYSSCYLGNYCLSLSFMTLFNQGVNFFFFGTIQISDIFEPLSHIRIGSYDGF